MCYECYRNEYGSAKVINTDVAATAELINKLYEHGDCGVGGYAHIVVDDWNLEDENIEFCIREAEKGDYDISEESRLFCLKTLNSLLSLTINERATAMAMHENYI